MFTGIIEALGVVKSVVAEGTNRIFTVASPLSDALSIDQSLAHNGVCLTVTALAPGIHSVTAVKETLEKTNLGTWQPGTTVNLERSLQLGSRLDGHIVQGHVDSTGTCTRIVENNGSWNITIAYPAAFAALIIEKGSITLNGISLTVFDVGATTFTVTIIPYTWQHTNIHALQPGDAVNLEFDILGKYVNRMELVRKEQNIYG